MDSRRAPPGRSRATRTSSSDASGLTETETARVGEDRLYDEYLDVLLRGEDERPDAFLARHGPTGEALRARLAELYRVVESGDELPTREAALADAPRIAGYRLTRLLGAGGQGRVWQAIQLSANRKVAVKVLRPDRLEDTQSKARFEQERRILALIDHPNIVRVLDHGELATGELWHTTEYVAGDPLDRYVNRLDEQAIAKGGVGPHAGFPLRRVLELMVRVCDAVQTAHQVGVIHRDLKPSNILVDDDGEPRVLDFGIARSPEAESPDALTLTGEFIGSPAWASPEQVEAEPGRIDVRTDVYSLGVVLYHLLTGTFPYDVSGPIAKVFDAIRHDEPRPPRELVTYIDDELEAVLLQTLAKERERRYASVQEFRDDLERYLLNKPVRAKGEGRWYQFRKLVSRHRALAAALAVAFVLSLGFGVVMLVLYQSQVAATERAEKAERIATENEQRTAEAERDTRRSLAEAAARAARLATQRGDWRSALAYFEEAIASGYPDEVKMRLGIVEAHDALNEDEIARNLITELVRRDDLGDRRGAVLLWQGELELFRSGGREDAIEFIEAALVEGLGADDEAHARGLLADTVPEALRYFQEALEHDPFHHRAIGMLGVSYLILGDLEQARRQFAVTSALFPEDPAVRIVYAATCALQGDRPSAVALIEQTRPQVGDEQSEALLELVDLVIEMHDLMAASTPLTGDDKPVHAMFARLLSVYAKLSRRDVAQGELGLDWLTS
ncbi:MAG: protein kinase, partial [Planctomycetes bacterium]|nr:protein kinase [Planctomycetota bacterium]